ncbi:MAG: terminase small subunit, partial [Planctomycetota bacterium]
MTDRQRRFVDAYAITRRGAAAAIAAGYGAKWASSAASRLLKQPEVLAALQRRIAPKATVPAAPLEPLLFLLRTMNDPEARLAARMQAAIAAAPFVHSKPVAGKRARQQEA